MDADEFADAYREHRDVVCAFLLRRLGHRETAEDLTAETFTRALKHWDDYTETGRGRGPWLITIARHLLLDHVKAAYVRREVPTAEMADEDRLAPGVWEHVEQQLCREAVEKALFPLVPNQRRCLRLRFFADLSVAQTAAQLGISPVAARQLQLRALAAARRHLTTGVVQ